jgi:hypothetical protein
MSEGSFKRVEENFTWQKVAERHMACFKEILSK